MYKKCYTPEEKERIIVLLSEVINEDLIKIVLDFSISVRKLLIFLIRKKIIFSFSLKGSHNKRGNCLPFNSIC
jgi:hypothetical protein